MRCANCGAELKVGCIYCSVCGKEAQIVSDYNLLEDDFLRDMLKEREEKIKKEAQEQPVSKESVPKEDTKKAHHKEPVDKNESNGKKGGQKRKVKKRIIFAVTAMILLVILIVTTVLLVKHNRANSYDYQMEQAQKYIEAMNYRDAENSVKRALELDEDSIEAKLLLVDIYVLRSEDGLAEKLLEKICREHPDNQEAYRKLIDIYTKQKNYEAIRTLSTQTEDEDVIALFTEYFPLTPEFDMEEGSYMQEISVGISVEDECTIYYTVDGSDPKSGTEYLQPIPVMPGESVQIRAIAKNKYELYGDEAARRFQVEIQKPAKPKVSPSSGSFYDAQNITVTVPEGCKVYYTWDSTMPDTSSKQYTEPLDMPEGNNILSLIAVDGNGMKSDVVKCNYIYMP